MTKQVINVGTTANDRHGDSLRTAFIKVNQNFAEIYAITNIAELTELSQDYAAALFTNGHHIGITVHYDDVHNTIDLTVLGMISTVVTANIGATYNVTLTDQYVGTTRSATGTGTITLPLGSTVPVGRQYIIKDEGGSSGSSSSRITVATSGGNTIDGSSTRGITSNYGSLTVLWTGTIWSVI